MQFYVVYVREAHPTDGWQLAENEKAKVLLASAKSIEEKHESAGLCVRKLGIEFPTLIDNLDNQVELNYSAWPDRLYLVDPDGKIAYKSEPGPWGFKSVELEAAIRRLPAANLP